jgi:hypothetical protein
MPLPAILMAQGLQKDYSNPESNPHSGCKISHNLNLASDQQMMSGTPDSAVNRKKSFSLLAHWR